MRFPCLRNSNPGLRLMQGPSLWLVQVEPDAWSRLNPEGWILLSDPQKHVRISMLNSKPKFSHALSLGLGLGQDRGPKHVPDLRSSILRLQASLQAWTKLFRQKQRTWRALKGPKGPSVKLMMWKGP